MIPQVDATHAYWEMLPLLTLHTRPQSPQLSGSEAMVNPSSTRPSQLLS